jgi:hypothetical protein
MSKPYLGSDYKFLRARKTKEVEITLGGEQFTVILRELSVRQLAKIKDMDAIEQLAEMIVDADGNQVYTTPDQIANLAELPPLVAKQLFDALSGLMGTSVQGQEETLKN